MAITKASAQTTVNSGVNAAAAATVNEITVAPATATTVAGGGTLGGVTISNVSITDSTFANVLSGDTAVSSAGGFVRITGTGFKTGANVFLGSTVLANTFVDSTRINANIPATAAGNYQFTVFNTDGSGAISPAGLLISGPPSWTSIAYSSVTTNLGIQLLASGDAPLTYYIQPGSSNPQNLSVNSTGYISGTVSGDGSYILTVVVDDAQLQSTQADVTITVNTGDPYFNLTTLLLPGDGTNNANNQSFTDSSTSALSISRTGNATQGTFTPFSQTGWSVFFDGTGDRLELANNAALTMGTGDFTIEAWVFSTASQTANSGIVAKGAASTGFTINVTGTTVFVSIAGGTANVTSAAGAVPVAAWTHVAFVRSGTTIYLFVNGVQVDSNTSAADLTETNVLRIGANRTNGAQFAGYISNLRILKGTALYTAAFTPSTIPLTAVTNTVLLTCQSPRFVDNSTNNFAITPQADAIVRAISPFNTNTSYSAATIGGSGFFDGAGDLVTVTNSTGLQFGQSSFTIEFWMYRNSTATSATMIHMNDPSVTGNWGIIFSGGTMFFQSTYAIQSLGNSFTMADAGINPYTWAHVAYVRNGIDNSSTFYVNGKAVGTPVTDNTNYAPLGGLNVGGHPTDSNYGSFHGYISNLRIVKGTAVYTGNFTPPTALLSTSGSASASAYPSTTNVNTSFASSETAVLLNFTNAGIIDATAKNNLQTVGDTKLSTAQSKFGGTSILFDGSGDNLRMPTSSVFNFGTNDFTIECWVYFNALTSNRLLLDRWASANANSWQLYWRSTGTSMTFLVGASTVLLQDPNASRITTGQWYHIAVARSGTTNNLFVDGTIVATATDSTNLTNTLPLNIGSQVTTNTNYLNAYLDDIRITNGYARYTANFTPPTASFKLR